MSPRAKRQLAAARRWAMRIRSARSIADKRRCARLVCAHLKAMLEDAPTMDAPGQGSLIPNVKAHGGT